MGWRRGRSKVVEAVTPAVPAGSLPCQAEGCGRHDGVPCAYVDRRGRGCESAWCPQHVYTVRDVHLCRRHVRVFTGLGLGEFAGSMAAPDVDNRVASLVEFVADAVSHDIEATLDGVCASEPALSLTTEGLAGPTPGTPGRVWRRTWGVIAHTGKVCSVAIEVHEDDPTVVRLVANGRVLTLGVPPWVSRHESHHPVSGLVADLAERAVYYERLLAPLRPAVQRDIDLWRSETYVPVGGSASFNW